MPRFSFGLLFLVLLGILGVQNLQPSLAITFLGQRSPALPLSLWIVAAVSLGCATGVTILWLIGPDPGRGDRPRKPSRKSSPDPPTEDSTKNRQDQGEDDFNFDDHNFDTNFDDNLNDRELDDPEEDAPETIPQDKPLPNYRPGPRPSAPYSYSYRPSRKVTPRPVDDRPLASPPRSPAQPSAKSKNDVYDADYRILTPPYPKADPTPPTPPRPPEDDWDDWEDWDTKA